MNVMASFRLDGRVAIVTGGAGMLGTALSAGLAEAGAAVAIASRDRAKCETLAAELRKDGLSAVGLPLDLADDDSIVALRDEVIRRFGRIDILVNNSVSKFPGHVETLPVSEWERAMRVDGTGFFYMTQVCLQQMLKQERGNIINIASIYGLRGADPRIYPPNGLAGFRPNYFFIKAGIINFTRFLAVAYAGQNIRVNCLSPGGIETNRPTEIGRRFADRTPMGRLARPEEFKGAIVFLASEASGYMTGHNLVVDGGFVAW